MKKNSVNITSYYRAHQCVFSKLSFQQDFGNMDYKQEKIS